MSNCIPDLEVIKGQLNEIIELMKPPEKGLKRYWLFAWDEFSACGGFNDFIQSYETEKEAMNRDEKLKDDADCNTYQIIDSKNLIFG